MNSLWDPDSLLYVFSLEVFSFLKEVKFLFASDTFWNSIENNIQIKDYHSVK